MKKKPQLKASTPGPKPDRLKIKGTFRDAIKRSLEKKKPPGDWPK